MNFCRTWTRWFFLGVMLPVVLTGCGRAPGTSSQGTPPNPKAPALYGPPIGVASKEMARSVFTNATSQTWQNASAYILQTELSPALLVHSESRHLGFFAGMTNHGLGAPKFVAWSTMNGPRTFKGGEKLDVTKMEECWVLVWWAGAEGWTNWDSPWVVYLQHKPDLMSLDEDGLHFEFPKSAGDVVLMPLYGYEKPSQKGHDLLAEHGLAGRKTKIKTWDWPEVLTRDPLTRIRYWAAATRELPVYCEESFSVDRANDSVTIRSRFQRRTIIDDWKTRRIKLAPLSPTLALAVKSGGLPVQFSKPWFDLDYATLYGPYFAVQGADEFDVTFPVLHYINETEASEPPVTNTHPTVAAALAKLRHITAQEWATTDQPASDANESGDLVGAWSSAKALPFLDEATRSRMTANYSRQRLGLIAHARDVLSGKAGSTPGGRDGLLGALWTYAHFAGDWDLVKDLWPNIRRGVETSGQVSWMGFGERDRVALGGGPADWIAFARLAYKAGDMDSYNYASYLFARELVQLVVKQRGADYFRQFQPWHSMEFMDDEVFPTHLSKDTGGWQLDGPRYPERAVERRFEKRWSRFNSTDVARFYRDYLGDDVRRELNWLQHRWEPARRWNSDPQGLPSLVQLRSLLLNETPAALATVASPDQFTGSPLGQIASCLAILRTSHPTHFDRLIPPGEPSAFVAGVERESSQASPALVVEIASAQSRESGKSITPVWPRLIWPHWVTPAGVPWTFGEVRLATNGPAARTHSEALGWNARITVMELP